MIYGFCEKIWTIVVFVNRSHTHVLQNTIYTFTSLFDNIGSVNPLNAKIVAANLSCSAKVVFVNKRWRHRSALQRFSQCSKALFKRVWATYRYYLVFIYTHIISCALLTAKAKKLAYLTNGCRRRFARSSSTCSSYVPYSFVVAWASVRYIPSFAIVAYTVQ